MVEDGAVSVCVTATYIVCADQHCYLASTKKSQNMFFI
jgi:hypothetical protein